MKQEHTLFPMYLVIFFGFMGYSLMITVFSALLLQADQTIISPGASLATRTITLGITLSLYPFGQFLSSPVLGAFSDRFGRRPILIISLAFTTLFYFCIAISLSLLSLTAVMLFLFLAGLSEGNVAIAQSAIADISQGMDRSRRFGYIYFAASTAYIIGPLLGGKLAGWLTFSTPFWVVCVLIFLTLLWIICTFRETHPPDRREHLHYLEALTNMKNIVISKEHRLLYFSNFFLYLAIFGFLRSYPMYIVDTFQVGVSKLSEYIAWVSVPIVLVNIYFMGKVARKFSPFQITLWSSLLVGIFIEILLVPKAQAALWITLFLVASAIAFALPSTANLLSINTEPKSQGRVMSNNQSLLFFAEFFSGITAGLLAAIFVKLSLIIVGGSSFLGIALLLYWKKSKNI